MIELSRACLRAQTELQKRRMNTKGTKTHVASAAANNAANSISPGKSPSKVDLAAEKEKKAKEERKRIILEAGARRAGVAANLAAPAADSAPAPVSGGSTQTATTAIKPKETLNWATASSESKGSSSVAATANSWGTSQAAAPQADWGTSSQAGWRVSSQAGWGDSTSAASKGSGLKSSSVAAPAPATTSKPAEPLVASRLDRKDSASAASKVSSWDASSAAAPALGASHTGWAPSAFTSSKVPGREASSAVILAPATTTMSRLAEHRESAKQGEAGGRRLSAHSSLEDGEEQEGQLWSGVTNGVQRGNQSFRGLEQPSAPGRDNQPHSARRSRSRSRSHDRRSNSHDRRSSNSSWSHQHNDSRPPFVANEPPRGRGRGIDNRPAWMSRAGAPVPAENVAVPRDAPGNAMRAIPPAGVGRGRGRGIDNRPAWMSRAQQLE